MFTLLAGRVHPIRHRIEIEHNLDLPDWAIAIGIMVIVAAWYSVRLYLASLAHKGPA